uniref:Uncharacterized protein n=1 Tax=Chromera velia CCMP2878 TaxID=1169474 RepID=A0A0G4HDL5_9ALVE|eukprot:Cvel_26519.t1-p1 / transcript=Cvel_26519.t1 / gene=Cvel_26519 / organism=Chromera_velia_CCMP2878 / gene_product=hypothetical protein / transcript_product=hypothetical protein / location=Cvel_scaffold3167:10084-12674(+) / protein_length=353 / sequence_SO=supercontig / SO=protein_coding / is_pseudo=false
MSSLSYSRTVTFQRPSIDEPFGILWDVNSKGDVLIRNVKLGSPADDCYDGPFPLIVKKIDKMKVQGLEEVMSMTKGRQVIHLKVHLTTKAVKLRIDFNERKKIWKFTTRAPQTCAFASIGTILCTIGSVLLFVFIYFFVFRWGGLFSLEAAFLVGPLFLTLVGIMLCAQGQNIVVLFDDKKRTITWKQSHAVCKCSCCSLRRVQYKEVEQVEVKPMRVRVNGAPLHGAFLLSLNERAPVLLLSCGGSSTVSDEAEAWRDFIRERLRSEPEEESMAALEEGFRTPRRQPTRQESDPQDLPGYFDDEAPPYTPAESQTAKQNNSKNKSKQSTNKSKSRGKSRGKDRWADPRSPRG